MNETKPTLFERFKALMDTKPMFVVRLFITTFLIVCVPLLWLNYNTDIFKGTNLPPISLGALIVLIILLAEVVILLRFYLNGMKTKYSFLKQVIDGFLKIVMPIIIAWVILTFMKDNVEQVVLGLKVMIPCCSVAVVINPLPKWAFNNNVDGLIDITSKLFVRKEEQQQ